MNEEDLEIIKRAVIQVLSRAEVPMNFVGIIDKVQPLIGDLTYANSYVLDVLTDLVYTGRIIRHSRLMTTNGTYYLYEITVLERLAASL